MNPEAISRLLYERQQLSISPLLATRLALYLELLVRWNARTNLSAVRDPEQIVLRHFGESLQCAAAIPQGLQTLLDFGSGAGFPGMPCALARSEITVTLAESQQKKAAFLQELSRTLNQPVTIHAGRVETMPAMRRFDVVTMRAVDRMQQACLAAQARLQPGGWLIVLTTQSTLKQSGILRDFLEVCTVPLCGSEQGVLAMARRKS